MKILIIDDSSVDRNNIQDIISDMGYKVFTAKSGQEGLEKVKMKPDLIFCDIIMEGMDGYKVCRNLKNNETTKNIPIVFVSAKNQKVDKIWATNIGGAAYITKPYQASEIVDIIKHYNI